MPGMGVECDHDYAGILAERRPRRGTRVNRKPHLTGGAPLLRAILSGQKPRLVILTSIFRLTRRIVTMWTFGVRPEVRRPRASAGP